MPPNRFRHDDASTAEAGGGERQPLLNDDNNNNNVTTANKSADEDVQIIDFTHPHDPSNPRDWSRPRKFANVALVALMAILSPLASSAFTPGISQIAHDLHTPTSVITGATTGFVICLGIGPLILAPLSEMFGRRKLYLVCFSIFAVAQIPTALAGSVAELLVWRGVAGFFGSVGIANGGGTLSDMFEPKERAGVFGWYLLGPLLGPTLGPLLGGVVVERLGWRWLFGILGIVAGANTAAAWGFLRESYGPVILKGRKMEMERRRDDGQDDGEAEEGRRGSKGMGNGADEGGKQTTKKEYRIPDEDTRPLKARLSESIRRPIRILFTQPIVLVMSSYIAILFGTTYSLWTNFEAIYGTNGPLSYNFSTTAIGLLYLGPGLGFLLAVWFIVPRIDTVFNKLTEQNGGRSQPEFRLPLANIGAVVVPLSLFWYAWTVEYQLHWLITISATVFFGLGQICIMNTVQNYYIDAYAKYAASAIAAGSVFRSLLGGIMPLAANKLFDKIGYGWGISVFAFAALALAPAPLLFYRYGPAVRERFAIDL